eukprot:TRINITY_DN50425_c0_g1_i1.p1 TRINITY_DN50425_c0_g1~~TRINITY_DN50425_c0_g1_i1.p1  ORF type:complete len:1091 (-),score=113.46 TRINITY_DN50425_c0_g1_i1:92-3364(-)
MPDTPPRYRYAGGNSDEEEDERGETRDDGRVLASRTRRTLGNQSQSTLKLSRSQDKQRRGASEATSPMLGFCNSFGSAVVTSSLTGPACMSPNLHFVAGPPLCRGVQTTLPPQVVPPSPVQAVGTASPLIVPSLGLPSGASTPGSLPLPRQHSSMFAPVPVGQVSGMPPQSPSPCVGWGSSPLMSCGLASPATPGGHCACNAGFGLFSPGVPPYGQLVGTGVRASSPVRGSSFVRASSATPVVSCTVQPPPASPVSMVNSNTRELRQPLHFGHVVPQPVPQAVYRARSSPVAHRSLPSPGASIRHVSPAANVQPLPARDGIGVPVAQRIFSPVPRPPQSDATTTRPAGCIVPQQQLLSPQASFCWKQSGQAADRCSLGASCGGQSQAGSWLDFGRGPEISFPRDGLLDARQQGPPQACNSPGHVLGASCRSVGTPQSVMSRPDVFGSPCDSGHGNASGHSGMFTASVSTPQSEFVHQQLAAQVVTFQTAPTNQMAPACCSSGHGNPVPETGFQTPLEVFVETVMPSTQVGSGSLLGSPSCQHSAAVTGRNPQASLNSPSPTRRGPTEVAVDPLHGRLLSEWADRVQGAAFAAVDAAINPGKGEGGGGKGGGAGKPRVLVTGATGLLGRCVLKAFGDGVWEVRGLRRLRGGPHLAHCDLTAQGAAASQVENFRPHVVLHLAAERRPDALRRSPARARLLNVNVTGALAAACELVGAWYVFLSCSCVFDGAAPPYRPDSVPKPLDSLGLDKLDGEKLVLASSPSAAILRVPLLYGPLDASLEESDVTNLLEELNRGALEFDDWERCYPTWAPDVAAVLRALADLRLAGNEPAGVLHWQGIEQYTRYEMLQLVAEAAGLDTKGVVARCMPHSSPAARDTRLDCSRLEKIMRDVSKLHGDGRRRFRTPFREAILSCIASCGTDFDRVRVSGNGASQSSRGVGSHRGTPEAQSQFRDELKARGAALQDLFWQELQRTRSRLKDAGYIETRNGTLKDVASGAIREARHSEHEGNRRKASSHMRSYTPVGGLETTRLQNLDCSRPHGSQRAVSARRHRPSVPSLMDEKELGDGGLVSWRKSVPNDSVLSKSFQEQLI